MSTGQHRPPSVLLVEPQFVLRRTLCAVAADLGLAQVTEAFSIESAQSKLKSMTFDALILGCVEDPALAPWMRLIRSGQAPCPKAIRIVVLSTPACTLSREDFVGMGADVVLQKPFKVGEVFEAAAPP
jgi:CheY-like chemotaxis protein